jgi:hypothetical protein
MPIAVNTAVLLDALTELVELEITNCPRLERIDVVARLAELQKLTLGNNGKVESLKPLRGLRNLHWLTFPESTNIVDGDLTPLLELPSLRKVAFQNRRHYSHRREQIVAALAR